MATLAWLTWDPSRMVFTIPGINLPLGWYGLFFASGFLFGYFTLLQIFTSRLRHSGIKNPREVAFSLTDSLCWCTVIGTIIGARLGHVFFYGWPYYREHLMEIPKVWEGGLASHGGVIGILVGLAFYLRIARRQLSSLTYLDLVDLLAIPSALVAVFIRIGNFINQEIVGTPTTMPWGVIFGHPVDGPKGVPLHPVQLYEACWYTVVFLVLYAVWYRKREALPTGTMTGLLFTILFGGRIVLEAFKSTQGTTFFDGYLQTGQLLSVPLVIVGIWLLWRSYWVAAKSHGNRSL